jgi:arylsulfatase A-like enzyme
LRHEEDRYNFILIVSDTFRHDLLNGGFEVKNGVRCETPSLDGLAANSVAFERAYHASFPTVPNRMDLLTGRSTYTYYDWSPLPKGEITVASILRREDYVSMMIADTPHILKDGYNFDRDFDGWTWIRGQENDRYRTDPDEVALPCNSEKLRNVETTAQHIRNNSGRNCEEDWIPAKTAMEAVRWLKKNHRRRFLLYVDLFDPHEPWDAPEHYVERYNRGYAGERVIYPAYGPCAYLKPEELTHVRAMYAAEASLVDRWIGEILDEAESLGLYENTFVIFTSDHGFYLGEHGLVGKSIIFGEHHGLAPLYEEVCHIPLLIRPADSFQGAKKGERRRCLAQTPDITATICDLAGAEEPRIQGKSLVPVIRGVDDDDFRAVAVSTPSLISGARAGIRATITSGKWSLVLAPEVDSGALEERTYTAIVDGRPRILKPYGRIETELYDLDRDPGQSENILEGNADAAKCLHARFMEHLKALGAPSKIIEPWLKYKGIR